MIELRWATPASTTASRPKLQYRVVAAVLVEVRSEDAVVSTCDFVRAPGRWLDVPHAVVPQKEYDSHQTDDMKEQKA